MVIEIIIRRIRVTIINRGRSPDDWWTDIHSKMGVVGVVPLPG